MGLPKPQQPEIERKKDIVSESVERHPAYAQIGASRVSGNSCLYGSDFRHHHYITISIHASALNRGLNRDWPFAREEYIEVALSEAQWATFVSAMNIGQGVQCTLTRRNGALIPPIAEPPQRRQQFKQEMAGHMKDIRQAAARLKGLIEKGGGKAAMREEIDKLMRELGPNLEFVASQFSEHVENTAEAGKAEVAAFLINAITRAGLESLIEAHGLPIDVDNKKIGSGG